MGVFSSLSVMWLLLRISPPLSVVANSHSNNLPVANRQSPPFPSWLILSRLIAAPTNRQSLPFDHSLLAIRHSLPAVLPVANR
jgi:hypothetical protein